MIFKNNKTYDKLKTLALVMPAVILFYGSIGKIWSIPYTEHVVMTLTAFNTLVASVVKIANNKYNNLEEETDYSEDDLALTERDDE